MGPDKGHGPYIGGLGHEFGEGVGVVSQPEVGLGFPVLLGGEEVGEETRGLDTATHRVFIVEDRGVGGAVC